MGLCLSCKIKGTSSKLCGDLSSTSALTPRSNNDAVHDGCFPVVTTIIPASESVAATMANSFNNNFTNSIKGLVSKKRNRYKKDGFDLDLTYITDKIIAMGYPASKIEGVYRNHIDDVARLLDLKHRDHYKIYNLCSERTYDSSKFHNRVHMFPFDDHNPPKIDLIEPFCKDVHAWLNAHIENVAAVHCKAGKGRTGTMICCYLLHSQLNKTADEALNFYGQTRTQDRKGVTIPSQVRYVKYYEKLIREKLSYDAVSLYVTELKLEPPPTLTTSQSGVYFTISSQNLTKKCKSQILEIKKTDKKFLSIKFDDSCVPITGDIKIEFYTKSAINKVKQFQFWFNTYFVTDELPNAANGFSEGATNSSSSSSSTASNTPPADRTLFLTLAKSELDIVNKKDKQNKTFTADFKITLLLRRVPTRSTAWLPQPPQEGVGGVGVGLGVVQDSPSGSSEGDSSDDEDDEEWDSVVESEMLDPRGVGYRLLSECEIASQLATSASHEQQHLLTA